MPVTDGVLTFDAAGELVTPADRNAYWRATNNPGAIESAYLGVSSLAVAGGATTTVVIDLPAEWAQ